MTALTAPTSMFLADTLVVLIITSVLLMGLILLACLIAWVWENRNRRR